jgi:hypothetical protein
MILFDIVVHVGTLMSMAVVMWPALSALVAEYWLTDGQLCGGGVSPTCRT